MVVVCVSRNQVLASQFDGSPEVGDRLDGTVSDGHHQLPVALQTRLQNHSEASRELRGTHQLRAARFHFDIPTQSTVGVKYTQTRATGWPCAVHVQLTIFYLGDRL